MKDHLDRMSNVFLDSLPNENTEEYKKIVEWHEKRNAENPKFQQETKKRFESARNSLYTQYLSHTGLLTSSTIRHFLSEFNTRTWEHGLRTLPLMFNILEGFFDYHKYNIYFELLEEEDYILSFFDFLDFYTSKDFKEDKNLINETIVEDLIYHFNIGVDIDEITFKTPDGEEFVVGGISIVRRGNEVSVLLTTGLIFERSDHKTLTEEDTTITPGKEKIKFDNDTSFEPVLLNDNPKYWKTLAACRIDLDSGTIDAKYIAKELENSFTVNTDEIDGFLKSNGEFISDSYKDTYLNSRKEIEKFNALFEVAKVSLYLPHYLNLFEDKLIVEDHETELKKQNIKPYEKRKFRNVPKKLKHLFKEVYILNIDNKFSADRIIVRDDLFNVETTGYWKKLNPDEVGTDKKGNQISGKTWITKTQSWFEAKNEELIVSKNESEIYDDENAGFIYVMRNPTMESDIFKIGLTTKTVDERAKQLSKTSVPDKFYKMNDWIVKDCYRAEKEIHEILKDLRVDPRREFFKIKMDYATEVISTVVNEINNE